MPFNATRIIPAGWSAHHQQGMPTSMNARVTVTDPARGEAGAWGPDTGTYGPTTPHYVAGGPTDTNPAWRDGVPSRIQRLREDVEAEQAGQQVTSRRYLLQLPADVPDIEVGMHAQIVAATNDPHLVGVVMEAADVLHGSERFTRDVILIHNQQPVAQGVV